MTADLALYRLVQQRCQLGFSWDGRCCFLWVCDAVLAVTGRDPGADLRGRYATWQQAKPLLRHLGGLQALAAARFGPRVQEPQDGDAALMPRRLCVGALRGHGALGVVWRGMVVVQGDASLAYMRLQHAQAFWRPAA